MLAASFHQHHPCCDKSNKQPLLHQHLADPFELVVRGRRQVRMNVELRPGQTSVSALLDAEPLAVPPQHPLEFRATDTLGALEPFVLLALLDAVREEFGLGPGQVTAAAGGVDPTQGEECATGLAELSRSPWCDPEA